MYCSVCEMMLMPSAGHFCDCCGVCADSAPCLRLVDQRHRCKETFATPTNYSVTSTQPSDSTASLSATESATTSSLLAAVSTPSHPPPTPTVVEPSPPLSTPPSQALVRQQRTEHLWVHGNLPLHQLCAVCGDDLDQYVHAAEPGLHGYRCCWCQRAVHTDCHLATDEGNLVRLTPCDFGEFRSMVIPPACVEAVVARGRRRIRLTAPEGQPVADWRPLFVIGESREEEARLKTT